YAQYLLNLFRVFFNTSLKQGQLKDQLLQSQLSSLLFNFFFIIAGGIYLYLRLEDFHWLPARHPVTMMALAIAGLGMIYIIKFLVLKLTGWLTGYEPVAENYLFIIFLINKIIGIFLVPVAVIMAFSTAGIANAAVWISIVLIGLMMVMRVFRSYGLFGHQLRV